MTIGEKLRAARVRKRLTQQELAEKIGVSQNTIACWEGGRTKPRGRRIRLLAGVLGIGTTDLVNGLIGDAA